MLFCTFHGGHDPAPVLEKLSHDAGDRLKGDAGVSVHGDQTAFKECYRNEGPVVPEGAEAVQPSSFLVYLTGMRLSPRELNFSTKTSI